MRRDKRTYEDDDGRTIADMGGVERPNLFTPRIPSQEEKSREAERRQREAVTQGKPSEEPLNLTPEERRWAILGVVKAGLLIALPYAIGLGLIIFLMDRFF